MNDKQVNDLLLELGHQKMPKAPDLRREVRTEIARLRERPHFWKRIFPVLNWTELLVQPQVAVCALVVALSIGAIPGVLSLVSAEPRTEAAFARRSLHFEVFEVAEVLPVKPNPEETPTY